MPIEFRCQACNKLLRVPDGSAGKKAKCPDCQTVIQIPAASPPQSSPPQPPSLLDEEAIPELEPPIVRGPEASPFSPQGSDPLSATPNPFESPTAGGGYRSTRRSGQQSGWVTAVAITSFVFGGLHLLCGGGFLFFGSVVAETVSQDPEIGIEGGEIIAAVVMGMGILFFLFGVFCIVTGFGVLKRQQWGRISALILGGLSLLLALFFLISLSPMTLLYIGYSVLVFVVLINSTYAAEFR